MYSDIVVSLVCVCMKGYSFGDQKSQIQFYVINTIYLFIYLFIQYFKRVTHLAVIAILPCGPLCKHIYIYTNTKVI